MAKSSPTERLKELIFCPLIQYNSQTCLPSGRLHINKTPYFNVCPVVFFYIEVYESPQRPVRTIG